MRFRFLSAVLCSLPFLACVSDPAPTKERKAETINASFTGVENGVSVGVRSVPAVLEDASVLFRCSDVVSITSTDTTKVHTSGRSVTVLAFTGNVPVTATCGNGSTETLGFTLEDLSGYAGGSHVP